MNSYRVVFLRSVDPISNQKMSNFHFDLSLKLPQGEVRDFSGEKQKFSGEVQNDLGGAHLPTKSGHARDCIFFHVHYYCRSN